MKAPREGLKRLFRFAGWPACSGAVRVGIAAMLTLAGAVAFAADDNKIIFPSGPAASPAPSTTSGGGFNTMTLVLALVLAAAGAWVLWRKRSGNVMAREGRSLAIEETRSLGNRQFLVVASYEGKKFLLGVCPGKIDMLAPLNEARESEEVS